MRRSKQPASPAGQPDTPTQEQVAALTSAVEQLTQQVQVLTDTLGQVREDLNWAINNREEFGCEVPPHVMHIRSMAKDPCAPDFGERLNRFSGKDLGGEDREPTEPNEHSQPDANPPEQRELW